MNKIYIATNNGDIGGGEIMLLNIARALRNLEISVTIISPSYPSELLEAAHDEGFETISLAATNRKKYIAKLRIWRLQHKEDLLWCNGLVPSFATANLGSRIVHLHQMPQGAQKLAYKLARYNAAVTLVPSKFMADRLPGAQILSNWVPEVAASSIAKPLQKSTISVGFLGRISEIKGTDLLAEAIYKLNQIQKDIYFQLVIGGEYRFIDNGTQNRVSKALEKLGESVVTLGWVDPQDFFRAVDCVAMPSQWDEPFGLVAAETMSARKPLLVTESGALPSIVGEDYPWVAEKDSVDSIAEKLLNLAQEMRKSSDEYKKIIENNYRRWYENYSPQSGENSIRRILEYFI